MRFGVHVEVDFSALPRVADFTKARGDQAQQGSNIWKDSDDAGPSFGSTPKFGEGCVVS